MSGDVTWHSVLVQQSLWEAIEAWVAERPRYRGQSEGVVFESIIRLGLAKPAAVKKALTRAHLGYGLGAAEHPLTKPVGLHHTVWDRIAEYRRRYKLPSRSEAVRELLRLGLGLPEPAAVGGGRGNHYTPGPHDGARKQRITALYDAGWSAPAIAADVGVSRTYVYAVLKRRRRAETGTEPIQWWTAA